MASPVGLSSSITSSSTLHNREPPFGNAICHAANVQRAYNIHRDKMDMAKPSLAFSQNPPERYEFLDSKITKNYRAQLRGQEIMRENMALLKKLARIQAEPVEKRQLREREARPKGPGFGRLKEEQRRREGNKIATENQAVLARLQNVKPNYSAKKFARKREAEEKVLWLRATNHTTGHLMLAPRARSSASAGRLSRGSQLGSSIASEQSGFGGGDLALAAGPYTDDAGGGGGVGFGGGSPLPLYSGGSPGGASAVGDGGELPPVEVAAAPASAAPASGRGGASPVGSRGSVRRTKTGGRASKASKGGAGGSGGGDGALPPVEGATPSADDLIENGDADVGGDSTAAAAADDAPVERTLYDAPKSFKLPGMAASAAAECRVVVKALEPLTFLSGLDVSVWRGSRGVASAHINMAAALALTGKDGQSGDADGFIDKEWDVHEFLMKMFLEADEDGNGTLSYDEFYALMEDADLGLSAAELQLLMAEADENDDGSINYNEFLPISIDLISSFKARRHAQRQQQAIEDKISEEAMALLYGEDVEHAIAAAEKVFVETDPRKVGTLSRPEFRRCIKINALNMTRAEQNMVMASMPVDTFGKIVYPNFGNIMYKVRYTTIRNAMMEKNASEQEKTTMELCREQEKKTMEVAHDQEPAYVGMITAKQLQDVLSNSKIGLTRLQVTSVMCDAEILDGMVDYWKFVPTASKTIEQMLDPKNIAEKAAIMEKASIRPEDYLNGKSEEQVQSELLNLFEQYDVDDSGELDTQEFCDCMSSLDLGLTPGQINALMATADTSGDGTIDKGEFMAFAFKHLMYLMREKHMAKVQNEIKAQAAQKVAEDDAEHALTTLGAEMYVDPSKVEDLALRQMESELIDMFKRADVDATGVLSANEFHAILQALDLGLSQYQMARLLAEADENEDGEISYAEFVPIGLRFLQAYKAKAIASRKWTQREAEAETKAAEACTVLQAELQELIHTCEGKFKEHDVAGTSRLPRDAFLRCLKSPQRMTRQMANMVASRMRPSPDDGLTSVVSFRGVMAAVHKDAIKRSVLEQMPNSALEKHLLQMFKDDELAMHGGDETRCAGCLPSKAIFKLLAAAKYLNLSRQQLYAVMSLKEQCFGEADAAANPDDGSVAKLEDDHPSANAAEAAGGDVAAAAAAARASDDHDAPTATEVVSRVSREMTRNVLKPAPSGPARISTIASEANKPVNFWKFASCAAEMISDFFDVVKVKRRATIAAGAKTHTMNLLKGVTKDELVEILKEDFVSIDPSRTGLIAQAEVSRILGAIPQLELTTAELNGVIDGAPQAEDGRVLWKVFIDDAHDIIMGVAYDREVTRIETIHAAQFDENGEVKALDADTAIEVIDKLIGSCTLELENEKLALAFKQHVAPKKEEKGRRPGDKGGSGPGGDKAKRSGGKKRRSVTARGSMRRMTKRANGEPDSDDDGEEDSILNKVLLHKGESRVVIVDGDGMPLDASGKPTHGGKDAAPPDARLLQVEIRKRTEVADGKSVELATHDPERETTHAVALRLPSLAVVDPDSAASFLKNVVARIRLVHFVDPATGKHKESIWLSGTTNPAKVAAAAAALLV